MVFLDIIRDVPDQSLEKKLQHNQMKTIVEVDKMFTEINKVFTERQMDIRMEFIMMAQCDNSFQTGLDCIDS